MIQERNQQSNKIYKQNAWQNDIRSVILIRHHLFSYDDHFQFYLLKESSSASGICFLCSEFICVTSVRSPMHLALSLSHFLSFFSTFVVRLYAFPFSYSEFTHLYKLDAFPTTQDEESMFLNGRPFLLMARIQSACSGALEESENNEDGKWQQEHNNVLLLSF